MHRDVYGFFDRVVAINLDRRRDRWERFLSSLPSDWPFQPPIRFSAIDGGEVPLPPEWKDGCGAWGCFLSHCQVLRDCINDKIDSVLILEDDAVMCPGFATQVRAFLSELPEDWGIAYLGGQHIHLSRGLPSQISEWVYRPFNVNRMHAYAVRGHETMAQILEFVNKQSNWTEAHHVDHFLGAFQERYPRLTYVPKVWLAAQMEGISNISGRNLGFRVFQSSEDICYPQIKMPVVCVLGNFGKTPSIVAGALHAAGVSMGIEFESPPNDADCTFESTSVTELLRALIDEPSLAKIAIEVDVDELLLVWASAYTQNFLGNSHAGVRHPMLVSLLQHVVRAWENPFVIVAEGNEQEAISGVLERHTGIPLDTAMNLVRSLDSMMQDAGQAYATRILRIRTESLQTHPAAKVDEMFDWIGYQPSVSQRESAIKFIRDSYAKVQASRLPTALQVEKPLPSIKPQRSLRGKHGQPESVLFTIGRPAYPLDFGGAPKLTHLLADALQHCGVIEDVTVLGEAREGLLRSWEASASKFKHNRVHANKAIECKIGYRSISSSDFRSSFSTELASQPKLVCSVLERAEWVLENAADRNIPHMLFVVDAEYDIESVRRVVSRGAGVVCCSRFLQSRLESEGVKATVVYPTSTRHLEAFGEVGGNRSGHILMINAYRVKGVETFFAIAERLPHRSFHLLESWPLEERQLAAIKARVTKASNVTFHRRTLGVEEHFQNAALLLVPSLWEEGFGMVAFESCASGIPVVASNRGGLPESVGDGGVLIEDFQNPNDWAREIESILSSRSRYEMLVATARKAAARPEFTTESAVDAFQDAIGKLRAS